MSLLRTGVPKLLRGIREASPADMLGASGVASGIVLVVFGIVLQDDYGVGFGATIRAMGGMMLLLSGARGCPVCGIPPTRCGYWRGAEHYTEVQGGDRQVALDEQDGTGRGW